MPVTMPFDRPTFEDLELLSKVSLLLTNTPDLDEVLQSVVDLVVKGVGALRASLFLFEGENLDWRRIVYAKGAVQKTNYMLVPRVMSEGLAGWVVRNKQPALVEDTMRDERWFVDTTSTDPARSALCVPLMNDGEIVAVMTMVHNKPRYFNEYHLRLLSIVANQLMVTIRQAQMFYRLQDQQRQLQSILHTIPDAILVLDKRGCILLANRTAFDLLNVESNKQAIGQRLTNLITADKSLQPVQQIIREIADSPLKGGAHWSFETRSESLKKDFQVTMTVWEDVSRGVVGYVIVMHDITTLRDLHRFKDEMLRVASHDLRSPLSLIIGYTDLIALDLPEKDSPIHEYLGFIRSSTERMSGLIDDLLRVERIRSSPLELHEQVVPYKLIKVVMVNMRLFAENKKQKLESRLDFDQSTHIMADPVLIRQAMENLIGNAIKYTPEGGHIKVETYVKNGFFFFAVEDNGFGIPADDIPRVFDSFYRAKGRNTKDIGGTGLGLSLVKTVVERHGGEIWVDSQESKGSRFTFRIPIAGHDTNQL